MKCPKCGNNLKKKKVLEYHFLESGLSYVYIGNIAISYCIQDKDIVIPEVPKLQELLDVIWVDIILNPQPLVGEDIRFLRQAIDLTQLEFAKLLGVTSNTMARWERGELRPTAAMDLTIRRAILPKADEHVLSLLKRRVKQLIQQKVKFRADLKEFSLASHNDLRYAYPERPMETLPTALKRSNNPLFVQEETAAYAFC